MSPIREQDPIASIGVGRLGRVVVAVPIVGMVMSGGHIYPRPSRSLAMATTCISSVPA